MNILRTTPKATSTSVVKATEGKAGTLAGQTPEVDTRPPSDEYTPSNALFKGAPGLRFAKGVAAGAGLFGGVPTVIMGAAKLYAGGNTNTTMGLLAIGTLALTPAAGGTVGVGLSYALTGGPKAEAKGLGTGCALGVGAAAFAAFKMFS